jgi:hypothetical protein
MNVNLKDLIIQALKEAFEVFCNKGVAGNSSAELLATFCDNILKKGGSEKLSDEAIEETLEKVHNIYNSNSMNSIHTVFTSPQHLYFYFYKLDICGFDFGICFGLSAGGKAACLY